MDTGYASQWMACNSIFRFIIYHRHCCIRGWSVFSKRTAGWHECPERYDERTCWSTSDSFVLFLTLRALLIHSPRLLRHLLGYCSCFSVPALLLSLVNNDLFLAPLFYGVIPLFFIFVFMNTFTYSYTISCLIFLCFDCDGVFVAVLNRFFSSFSSSFFSSKGWICWKRHGGKFILDRLPVHVWVFGQCKCVAQSNEPILAAPGSVSNFLFNCTPALSFPSSAPAHSFDLSLSWWRHLGKPKWQLTSTLITLNWPHKVALSYEQFSLCICLFSCFLSFLLALSVFLSPLNRRIPIHDSPTDLLIH